MTSGQNQIIWNDGTGVRPYKGSMIDTHKLDNAITDCLAEIGESGAGYVVLVHTGSTLAIGTNINNADVVAKMLETAQDVVTKRDEMGLCRGSA